MNGQVPILIHFSHLMGMDGDSETNHFWWTSITGQPYGRVNNPELSYFFWDSTSSIIAVVVVLFIIFDNSCGYFRSFCMSVRYQTTLISRESLFAPCSSGCPMLSDGRGIVLSLSTSFRNCQMLLMFLLLMFFCQTSDNKTGLSPKMPKICLKGSRRGRDRSCCCRISHLLQYRNDRTNTFTVTTKQQAQRRIPRTILPSNHIKIVLFWGIFVTFLILFSNVIFHGCGSVVGTRLEHHRRGRPKSHGVLRIAIS
mmetsp:Transcript_1321/g.2391  ORF Transcript_1321/g.2391 Transcript_1321/m.2391 type:complete len:254 (-) Transcript_1321:102-863(-)